MTNGGVRARVFETVVFTHLRALRDQLGTFRLYYFREDDKALIDFVLAFEEADAVLGVQVSSTKSPEKKLAKLKRSSERAGLDRVVLVHGGPLVPQKFERYSTWPIDAFLLDTQSVISESLEWIRKSR